MKAHTSASEVAKYLLFLAARESEQEPGYLTPLQLQKLLYFTQGWALAQRGTPLFHEQIEAWREGPVVPAVYAEYKSFSRKPITKSPAEPDLPPTEKDIIQGVWEAYKRYSAWALRDLTHEDPAYLRHYQPTGPKGECSNPIPEQDMAESFKARFDAMQKRLAARRAALVSRAEANTVRLAGRKAI